MIRKFLMFVLLLVVLIGIPGCQKTVVRRWAGPPPIRVTLKESTIEKNGEDTYLIIKYEISNIDLSDNEEHTKFRQKVYQNELECELIATDERNKKYFVDTSCTVTRCYLLNNDKDDVNLVVYDLRKEVYLDKTIVLK